MLFWDQFLQLHEILGKTQDYKLRQRDNLVMPWYSYEEVSRLAFELFLQGALDTFYNASRARI